MMKICQINCVYANGSTGKIVKDIHESLLNTGFESIVCYGAKSADYGSNIYSLSYSSIRKIEHFRGNITGLPFGGAYFQTSKLLRIIKKEKPDVVHLHCINGYDINIYWLLSYLAENKIKTILTNHAEFFYTGSCGHAFECEQWVNGCKKCPQLKKATGAYFFDRTATAWKKMKACFDKFDADKLIVTVVSPWVLQRASKSQFFNKFEKQVVLNGIDTDNVFHIQDCTELRQKYNLKNEQVILHVTASFDTLNDSIKGGQHILKLADKLKDTNTKIFVIANNYNYDKLPPNIHFIGRVADQLDLARYYSLADITLLTSKKETFSMPTAESLCCGTPVVGFKAGGPESIALKEYSDFVEYGDTEALTNACKENLFAKKNNKINVSCSAKDNYDKSVMINKYTELYDQILRGN